MKSSRIALIAVSFVVLMVAVTVARSFYFETKALRDQETVRNMAYQRWLHPGAFGKK